MKFNMRLASLAPLVLWHGLVEAIVIKDGSLRLPDSELPAFSCQLTIRGAKNDLPYARCSSTLISPSKVLTARHCFEIAQIRAGDEPLASSVRCASAVSKVEKVEFDPDQEKFSEELNDDNRTLHDHAILTLALPMAGIDWPRLPKSGEELRAALLSEPCIATGFGWGSWPLPRDGNGPDGLRHRGAKVLPQPMPDAPFYYFSGPGVSFVSGDSGGGIYCKDRDGWMLTGAIRAGLGFSSLEPALTWLSANQE